MRVREYKQLERELKGSEEVPQVLGQIGGGVLPQEPTSYY